MGFETKMLAVVEREVSGAEASFYYGTLSVYDITNVAASDPLDALKGAVTCDVKMSKIVHDRTFDKVEYLFDFV